MPENSKFEENSKNFRNLLSDFRQLP